MNTCAGSCLVMPDNMVATPRQLDDIPFCSSPIQILFSFVPLYVQKVLIVEIPWDCAMLCHSRYRVMWGFFIDTMLYV